MSESRALACLLAKRLCLPLTFRNLYVIELAIRAESQFASIPLREAMEDIAECAAIARQFNRPVDYFWFEDGRWRYPHHTFKERDELRMREKARYY